MLKIIGRKNSSNVQKVLWCCGELGIEFEREDAGREFGRNDTPEFLAMNPNGRVPVIDDNGLILWESNTIVRYLAAVHDGGALYPEDLKTRARSERWMDWQLSVMGPAFAPIFHALVRDPPEARDPAKIAAARDNVESKFEILERYLGEAAYLAGDELSVGDIPLGIHAYRWYQFDIERKTLPNVERWYDALCQRPAFQTHVMVGLD